jgi:hypothetical protein
VASSLDIHSARVAITADNASLLVYGVTVADTLRLASMLRPPRLLAANGTVKAYRKNLPSGGGAFELVSDTVHVVGLNGTRIYFGFVGNVTAPSDSEMRSGGEEVVSLTATAVRHRREGESDWIAGGGGILATPPTFTVTCPLDGCGDGRVGLGDMRVEQSRELAGEVEYSVSIDGGNQTTLLTFLVSPLFAFADSLLSDNVLPTLTVPATFGASSIPHFADVISVPGPSTGGPRGVRFNASNLRNVTYDVFQLSGDPNIFFSLPQIVYTIDGGGELMLNIRPGYELLLCVFPLSVFSSVYFLFSGVCLEHQRNRRAFTKMVCKSHT